MKITKFGHCCLLVKDADSTLLIDPGCYSNPSDGLKLDAIFITHQHADHMDMNLLKNIRSQNPNAPIYTCQDVKEILEKEGIPAHALQEGEITSIKKTHVKTIGKEHAILYQKCPCMNHGFLISNRFFFPGDALTLPNQEIEILALPVAGPWLKLSDAIEYVLTVKPKKSFPVHDGGLKTPGSTHRIPGDVLPGKGIEWIIPENGSEMDFG